MNNTKVFLPEWTRQSAVLIAWPHPESDWNYMLTEVRACFRNIVRAIAKFEEVILLVDSDITAAELRSDFPDNVRMLVVPTNDTWARDFGPIFIEDQGQMKALDFKFNGWGLKFAADMDNLINRELFRQGLFTTDVEYNNYLNFVLEGGSLESDGKGTLLTTTECLLSPNRNGGWGKAEIEAYLKDVLGLDRVLWLDHGYLSGDDTDSHIDTLARFCSPDTIAYVQCTDTEDEHYEALKAMEEQLMSFRTASGKPYRLYALPMADTIIEEGERLPATYANFLIINGAVLVPTYNSRKDSDAIKVLREAFPGREVIGVDCRALIKQHGSLHCVTMQLPEGVLS